LIDASGGGGGRARQSRTEMDRVPEVEELKIHTWTCLAQISQFS